MSRPLTLAESLLLLDDIPSDVDTPVESSDDDDIQAGIDSSFHKDTDLSQLLEQVGALDDAPVLPLRSEVDTSNLANSQGEPQVSTSTSTPPDAVGIVLDSVRETGTPVTVNRRSDRTWKKKPKETDPIHFAQPEGPVLEHFISCKTPTDYFLKYFSDDVRTNIVEQTMFYAYQKDRTFGTLSDEEFQVFLGINILMGYHKVPSYRHMWENDADVNVPIVEKSMARERFRGILTNLHVNNNLEIPQPCRDKLYKLRPMIDALNGNFMKLWSPCRVQSIDESMVKFKGRHSIKQYNPMKPIKRGYKIWVRGEMSGHTNEFHVYQGKGEDHNKEQIQQFGLGGQVVLSLSESLVDANYTLYFDNYFTSIDLMEQLSRHGIRACGTIRSNRKGLPVMAEDKQLDGGTFDYRISDTNMTLLKWKDNKSVHILSNFHGTGQGSVNRTEKDGTRREFCCPQAIIDYNANMGGVDKADMLKSLYAIDRKSKKWWHRIFFHLVDVSVVNAYVAYSAVVKKAPLLEFRRGVARGLLSMSNKPAVGKKRGRPASLSPPPPGRNAKKRGFTTPDDVRLRDLGIHRVKFSDQRGRCELCARSGIQSRPFSICSTCQVHLCCNQTKNCFDQYHWN